MVLHPCFSETKQAIFFQWKTLRINGCWIFKIRFTYSLVFSPPCALGFKTGHALVSEIGVLGTGGEDSVEAVVPFSTSCWEPQDEGGDLSVRWGTGLGTQKSRKRRMRLFSGGHSRPHVAVELRGEVLGSLDVEFCCAE